MIRLCLLFLLVSCADVNQRVDCESAYHKCMDVCQDHASTVTLIDLGASQKAKQDCLRLCFDEHRRCRRGE